MTFTTNSVQQFEIETLVPSSRTLSTFDTVITDRRAKSVHVKIVSKIEDHLYERVKAIVGDNSAIREVRSCIMDYEFSSKVGAEIWPRFTDKATKTDLATMQLTMLDKIVNQHAGTSDANVRLVISGLLGVMLQHQGIMSIELPTLYATIPNKLFPAFETMKREAMVATTYANISAIPLENAFYTNAVGNLALKTFAEVFAKYDRVFNNIILLNDTLDALGAGVVLAIHDKESVMGGLRGTLNHTSIESARRNYTFVRAAHEHFFTVKANSSVDSLVTYVSQVGSALINEALQDAWQMINQVEVFEFSSLAALKTRVNVYRFINNTAAPIGFVAQPLFKGTKEGLDISFYDDKDTKIVNLEQDKVSESYFEPMTTALYENVRSAIKSVAPMMSTVVMTSAGLNSFGSEVLNVDALNETYQPFGMFIGMDQTTIDHIAMSHAEQMSFGDPSDDTQCPYAYFFVRRQRDPEYHLKMVSSDLAYSENASDVILFSGAEGVSEATNPWLIGAQTLDASVRPIKYVGSTGFGNDKLPEHSLLLNRDQRLTREIKFSVDVPDGKGGATSHAVTTSLYELYAGIENSKWRKDICYPIAHVSPLLSEQTNDLVELFIYVAKQPKAAGMVHAPAERVRVQFANVIAPVIKSPTFKRLLGALRTRIVAAAVQNSMEERVALRYHIRSKDIDLKLTASILRYLLVRLGVVSWDTSEEMYNELLNTDTFYSAVLPLLVNEDN